MNYNIAEGRSDWVPNTETENFEKCLDDFGCDTREKAEIMECYRTNDTKGMIRLLRRRRQTTLNIIHMEEKQIRCLDYIVFQLEKDMETKE